MEFQRGSCGSSMDLRWITLGFLWETHGISMICLLEFYCFFFQITITFQKDFFVVKNKAFHDPSIVFPWDSYKSPTGFS